MHTRQAPSAWHTRHPGSAQAAHGGDCVQACAARHVAVADRCLPCHVSCAECAGVRSTECTACPGGLLPLPAGQPPMCCVPACPVGYHTSAAGCAPCGAHCAGCPEQAGTCALCERGWLLDAPSCVTGCPPSSVAQGGLPASPLLVGGTCARRVGPDLNQCTACPDGRVLSGGVCLGGCPAGLFAQEGICQACHGSCQTCDRADACTGCPAETLAQPGGLRPGTCPAGWAGCAAAGRCVACPEHCAACAAGGDCAPVCTVCAYGHLLWEGACHLSCPAGRLADPASGACMPCEADCRTCSGRGDTCTSCHSGVLPIEESTCAASGPSMEDLLRAVEAGRRPSLAAPPPGPGPQLLAGLSCR
ncbi:hypothetical protein H696_05390 [Fonticula alba]|uniref:R-spondin Fu-CRD domain-containing protein n=1 Tax=Fonticula alba TaxID=691883 RepID=A0A058Z1X1_FONAL|nr:hypothetical protein H696_05390 [Fonticula alba]KCV68131.1 hypothetical protein H696_05390 [Fonticula alba]|eukprot:XP_009497505.1 hypothetical protein H696_05390 [Fonticula alba]